ncbi:integrase core domain-containing protein, partial [Spirosoma knui]
RVNRTIKEDMLQNRGFPSFKQAHVAVSRAIESYNKLRPHSSCNYLTPEQAHQLEGQLKKRWGKSTTEDKQKVLLKDVILVTQNRP